MAWIKDFFDRCSKGSQAAYLAWKDLLQALEEESSRIEARKNLAELYAAENPEALHVHFGSETVLDANEQPFELKYLQFPSTFMPEAWSFTFYEGLIRYPITEFQGKRLIELGTGIGWVSLASSLRFLPEQMVGCDINPKAIICAKLNLFLNGLNDDGQPLILADGKSLITRVNFVESDLLKTFSQETNHFDHIIGCIPQVLNPEPKTMITIVEESASDEYLQSLSNYYAQQGYVEDEFGLGLIAQAVEQSVPLLKEHGKLILNFGCRPGSAVIERLFQRRGFLSRRIWKTRVQQAQDTDIEALVTIEEQANHRFEFFLDRHAPETVCAKTAQAYQNAGGTIYHDVAVYEALMAFPRWTKPIFSALQSLGNDRLRSALDLSFHDSKAVEERCSFLASLVDWIHHLQGFEYGSSIGLSIFRQQMAEFFRTYYGARLHEDWVVTAPSRFDLVQNLISLFQPKTVLIDATLRDLIAPSQHGEPHVLEMPANIDQLNLLIPRLKPDLVITSLPKSEMRHAMAFESLVALCQKHESKLVFDYSDYLDLSSSPEMNGLAKYMAENVLPAHVFVLTGLIHNEVFEKFTMAFLLNSAQSVKQALANMAELTYSRTSMIVQSYYAHIIEELLFFQRTRLHLEPSASLARDESFPLSEAVQTAFAHASLQENARKFGPESLRLDYGENELPAPEHLKQAILESFLLQPAGLPDQCEPILRQVLKRRFAFPESIYAEMVFGHGLAPLFNALMRIAKVEGKSLIFPAGSYGYFEACSEHHGLQIIRIMGEERSGFKISAEQLAEALKANPNAFVFLNGPLVNPTGSLYSELELQKLIRVTGEYQGTLILDTIFCGLEFESSEGLNLLPGLNDLMNAHGRFVLLGGISKEFSGGGLRFGYAWSPDSKLLEKMRQVLPKKPHLTLQYAVSRVYSLWLQQEKGLTQHMAGQVEKLAKRSAELSALLSRLGWQVLPNHGGLFLVAKPPFLGKTVVWNGEKVLVDSGNVSDLIFSWLQVSINGPDWTGIPGYCRFVLSTKDTVFQQALDRLETLDELKF